MKSLSTLLIFLSVSFGSYAQKIIWFSADFHPCHIPEGPEKNTGYCDLALKEAFKQLEQYEHVVIPTNSQRALAILRNKSKLACTIQFFKTPEREAFLYFSTSAIDVLPNGLIVWNSDERFEKFIDSQGRASIKAVVNDTHLVFGREKSRSYGPEIDRILNSHELNQVESTADVSYDILLKRKRVDFVPGYPFEKFGSDKSNIENEDFRFIPIKENTPLYQANFACSMTPRGQQVIQIINQKLLPSGKTRLNRFYEHWLHPSVTQYYRKMIKSQSRETDNQHNGNGTG